MKDDVDYDMPTYIRNGLRATEFDRGHYGLIWRGWFQALFGEFCYRAANGELIWR